MVEAHSKDAFGSNYFKARLPPANHWGCTPARGDREESSSRAATYSGHGKVTDIVLGFDKAGDGPLLLLLPALSSISTRGEMRRLIERLASKFRVVAVDSPGFGTSHVPASGGRLMRSPPSWNIISELISRPHAVVAAGHAATYVLHYVGHHVGIIDRLVLIAPTWRGPLPTMAGGDRPFFAKIRGAIEMPGIGRLLYRLNVNRYVVSKMVAVMSIVMQVG